MLHHTLYDHFFCSNNRRINLVVNYICIFLSQVLKDPSVSKDVLRARAIGLKKLGTIFQVSKKNKRVRIIT